MSHANYKKDYWLKELKNKMTNCKRDFRNPQKKEKVIKELFLVRNEITKELEENDKLKFNNLKDLYYERLTPQIIDATFAYLDNLNKFYIKRYKKASSKKNNIISDMQKTNQMKEEFIMLKKEHHNENLSDLVKNDGLVRIIEFEGQLFQKIDPVFQDPSSNFINAHFYAPIKNFFGYPVDTYWINLIIIWLMSVIFYIALYYQGLKRFLDFTGGLASKVSKKERINTIE
ncbi:MAG: hypothetical protein HY738_23890 [Bacteroidia bacterium]|nr:hypothetical protein [Bacteroidia bacterium]